MAFYFLIFFHKKIYTQNGITHYGFAKQTIKKFAKNSYSIINNYKKQNIYSFKSIDAVYMAI